MLDQQHTLWPHLPVSVRPGTCPRQQQEFPGGAANSTMHPFLFQNNALTSLQRCQAIFTERGDEYGDSWRHCRFSTMRSVCEKFGIIVPDGMFRMVALAAMIDQKYSRQEGGYKDDSMLDGINYQLALAEEVRLVEAAYGKAIAELRSKLNGTPDARPN